MRTICKVMVGAVVWLLFLGGLRVAEGKDYGPFVYAGSVDQRDTLTVAILPIWLGSGTAVGKYIYIASTTDLAAPMNEACMIQKHTVGSGLVVLDSASSASVGFSADVQDGDVLWLMDSPPSGAKVRVAITATKVASGVVELDYMLYLTNLVDDGVGEIDTTLENVRAAVATTLTKVDTEVGGALSAALQCSAYVADGTSEIDTTLENIRAGVAIIQVEVDTEIDTIGQYLYGTTGAQWGTATEPANGVNLFEGLGFLQNQVDTMTTIKLEYAEQLQEDLRDSLVNTNTALMGASGFPAVTAGKFVAAGGINLAEGLLFLHNTADTMNVTKLEYAEDMQEGIRDSLEDANDVLQSLAGITGSMDVANATNRVRIAVDLSNATWNTAATHEAITFTGHWEFWAVVWDSIDIVTASSDSIAFRIGAHKVLTVTDGDAWDAGESLFGFPGENWDGVARVITPNFHGSIWHGFTAGEDLGYIIGGDAATSGIFVIEIWAKPVGYSGGTMAAGAGGAL